MTAILYFCIYAKIGPVVPAVSLARCMLPRISPTPPMTLPCDSWSAPLPNCPDIDDPVFARLDNLDTPLSPCAANPNPTPASGPRNADAAPSTNGLPRI